MSTARELVFADAGKPEVKVDFMRTVSRHLTHKRRIENVYLTSLSQRGEADFVIGAYVPQANLFLNEMKSHPGDVTLTIAEIGRQAGMAVCHEYLGVGHANAFILNSSGLELLPALHAVDWSDDDTLVINVSVKETAHDEDGALRSIGATEEFYANGVLVCRQFNDWAIQPVERYRRLRELSRAKSRRGGQAMPEKIGGLKIQSNPQAKRSVLAENYWVAQGGASFVGILEVDQSNLFFFDHANDHVPGMLILEGMREMAVDLASRFGWPEGRSPRIQTIELSFKSFAELDSPVSLVAQLSGIPENGEPLSIHLEVRQAGKVLGDGSFIIAA